MKNFLLALLAFWILFSSGPIYALEVGNQSKIDPLKLEQEIDSYMKKALGKSAPGATVALSYKGETIFNKGYGLANIEKRIPSTKNTTYEYGSISKLFLWISILQLEEAGKVSLDGDIREYLPKDFTKEWQSLYPISLRDILNHSTGYGEYPFDLISNKPLRDTSLEKALLSVHPKQYLRPKEASAYSNYATCLGALVVENVSKLPYVKYVRENILAPLEMNTVSLEINGEDNPKIFTSKAQGYKGRDGKFINNGWSYVALYPSGSANGKAEDLLKLSWALEGSNSPLFKNPQTLKKIQSPSFKKGQSGTFHGFFDYNSIGGQILGHGGNTASFSSQFFFQPSTSLSLVILTNGAGEMDITTGLYDIVFAHDASDSHLKQVDQKASFPSSSRFTGTYSSLRKAVNTPFKFISYLQPMKIRAIKKDTLEISFASYKGLYRQIGESSYCLTSSPSPLIKMVFSKLHFSLDQNNKWMAHFGNGMDFLLNSGVYDNKILFLDGLGLLLSLLFFLIFPIFLLVQNRRKKSFLEKNSLYILLPYILSLTFLSFIVVFFLGKVLSNPLVSTGFIQGIQLALYASLIVAGIYFLLGLKRVKNLSNKKTFILVSILFINLINLFIKWDFLTPLP